MKPLFSDEERRQTVKNLIIARYNNQAKIRSFDRLTPYLNGNRVKILCKLEKSGDDADYDSYGHAIKHNYYYTEDDVETYFEWLVAVITGAEKVEDTIVNQANDQLFQFIHVLGADIQMDGNAHLLAPYDWQQLFLSFHKELIDIKTTVDHHDKEISDILKSVLEYLKTNKNLLEALQKEYEGIFPKGEP